MKTVNQLLDIGFELSRPRSKKIIRLLARLHDAKIISGGLTKIENSSDILKAFALENAGNINNLPPGTETS